MAEDWLAVAAERLATASDAGLYDDAVDAEAELATAA